MARSSSPRCLPAGCVPRECCREDFCGGGYCFCPLFLLLLLLLLLLLPPTHTLHTLHTQAYLSRISSQELITLGVQPSLLLLGGQQHHHQQQPGGANDDGQVPPPPPPSLVPLCCPPVAGAQATLQNHAQHLQQELQLLLPHSHLSLHDICAAANIQPASSMQHPLFQAGVVVRAANGNGAADDVDVGSGLDLVLVVTPTGKGSTSCSLLYNTGLITLEGAQLMAQHFQVCGEVLGC